MKALAIFGSTARNERSFDSDIDMLGIYDKENITSISEESVSLFLYPEAILRDKMVSGDLFALHLVEESIPIYGSEILKDIYDCFNYKESYILEINTALKLYDELLSIYDKLKTHKNANKKIAWCIRTIIISLSAQDRTPVFSKKKLSEYIQIKELPPKEILTLINTKGIKTKLPEKIKNKLSLLFKNLSGYGDFLNHTYDEKTLSQILNDINHDMLYCSNTVSHEKNTDKL